MGMRMIDWMWNKRRTEEERSEKDRRGAEEKKGSIYNNNSICMYKYIII